MARSEIVLKNMQIKSTEKLELLAEHLTEIEVECGIKEVKITFDNIFICPDVDLEREFDTPMENLIIDIISKSA